MAIETHTDARIHARYKGKCSPRSVSLSQDNQIIFRSSLSPDLFWILFLFFFFFFQSSVRTEISVSSLTSRFLEYETKSIVRSPAEIFFLESRIRRRLERRSDACGKFEEIKVFFFLIPSISSTRINGIYECDYQGWLYSIPFCFHFNNVCQIMDVYLAHNYSNYRLKIFFYLPDTRYLPNNYFTYPLWTQIVHDLIAYSWNNTVIIKLYV